ncbi:MAG: hypothetical protein IK024_12670 [Treponema sp.]|nr:hypothetical protein [Treponema sp.]
MQAFELMNEQVKAYLAKDKTDYALLISGEWGCGKTHYYKEDLQKNAGKNFRFIYHSLNGATCITDVVNSVFLEIICPEKNIKQLTTGKSLLSGVSKLFADTNINTVFNAGSLLFNYCIDNYGQTKLASNENKIVIVFDDLERISDKVDITDLLGTIHTKFTLNNIKIIYIADDTKIKHRKKFNNEKEKYILRTLAFANDKNFVFDSFLKEQQIYSEDFMFILHEVFNEPQVNLRTVRFCIECYMDLYLSYKELPDDKYNSPEKLFYSICQLGKFYKQGNSDKKELQEQIETYFYKSYLNRNEDKEKTEYEKFAEQYYSKLEKQGFIYDLIYDGVFSKDDLAFYLKKPDYNEDPIFSLSNIQWMETKELTQKLIEIRNNLQDKKYTYRQYGFLKDSFLPNIIKLKLDSEENIYNLIADSVFAEQNLKELTDTFGYWQKDSFSELKEANNSFEQKLLLKYEEYCKQEKEKTVVHFYTCLKNCDRSIFAYTMPFQTIYTDIINFNYLDKIFELTNKSIYHFSYFIDSSICRLIEAYKYYTPELNSLNVFLEKTKTVLQAIDENDFLKIQAIQNLQNTIELAKQHIDNKE